MIYDYNAVSDSPAGGGRDTIVGFNADLLDKIDLSDVDGNNVLAGSQAINPAQLSYVGGILTANIIGPGPDLQIDLLGAPLNLATDVIV